MLLTSMLWLDLVVGFLWGPLISIINYSYLQLVIKQNAGKSTQKATLAVVNAHFVRYFLNIAALVVVYKHMWVLVGTAVGLTVMLKYTIVMQFIESRKHPYVSKRPRRVRPKDAPKAGSEASPQASVNRTHSDRAESPDAVESTPARRPEPEGPEANSRL